MGVKKPIKVSPGEMELLELLWTFGDSTIAETHQHFLDKGKQIKYSTVQTRLNRLADKKLIERVGEYPAAYRTNICREVVVGESANRGFI